MTLLIIPEDSPAVITIQPMHEIFRRDFRVAYDMFCESPQLEGRGGTGETMGALAHDHFSRLVTVTQSHIDELIPLLADAADALEAYFPETAALDMTRPHRYAANLRRKIKMLMEATTE